jgi:hypothetical protein
MRGSRILLLLCLVGAAGVLAIAAAAVWFARSDRARGFRTGFEAAFEQVNAPGAKALQAIGCESGVVIPLRDMLDRAEARPSAQQDAWRDQPVAICTNFLRNPPRCEDVAVAVAGVAPDAEQVLVIVQLRGSPHCMGAYAPSGERVGDFDPSARAEE